ncbi:MAG: hypothetical protein ACFFBC_04965 [Promethearchaeota archaeon]
MNLRIKKKKFAIGIFLITTILVISISLINGRVNLGEFDLDSSHKNIKSRNIPKNSAFWASINITNYQLNGTRHYHNDTITVMGNLKYNNGTGVPFTEVAIFVDDIISSQPTNITNSIGDFQVNFRIPFNFDVYSISGYKIQVNITDESRGNVFKNNYLIIFANATSIFNITYAEGFPKIPGEIFGVEGFLRYDNMNGTGIPSVQINYNWFNSTYNWPSNFFFTSPSDGSFIEDIIIPTNVFNQTISLNLSYSGDFPYIGNSETVIPNIILFSNITCIWNIVPNASEEDMILIAGQIISMSNSSIKISNRTLIIKFDGNPIDDLVSTDSNGFFAVDFTIPSGIGNKSIEVEVVNYAGITLSRNTVINITAAPYTPSRDTGLPPFLMFSLIFYPILGGITAALAVLGYRYFRKQEIESRVVNLPLESKLVNLKILKDSGRLEESISYLFNAIYIKLVDAKYGRTRRENETIRDFAIVSVKELKLTPAAIYPFIQKVEEIIYAKPFKITESDFYTTCELFSPVYFQLTGYNFQLNF